MPRRPAEVSGQQTPEPGTWDSPSRRRRCRLGPIAVSDSLVTEFLAALPRDYHPPAGAQSTADQLRHIAARRPPGLACSSRGGINLSALPRGANPSAAAPRRPDPPAHRGPVSRLRLRPRGFRSPGQLLRHHGSSPGDRAARHAPARGHGGGSPGPHATETVDRDGTRIAADLRLRRRGRPESLGPGRRGALRPQPSAQDQARGEPRR